MSSQAEYLVVLCTVPDKVAAERIAARLVSGRLAACVNIVPGVESVYEWNGQVQHSSELLLMIKTTTSKYAGLQQRLEELHPYDTPEIIATHIHAGLPDYLNWISQATGDS